jgi:hypothetical protein
VRPALMACMGVGRRRWGASEGVALSFQPKVDLIDFPETSSSTT